MNSEEIYKDGAYLKNNQTWHVEDSPWKAKQILKMLTKNNLKPRTICEVGCGVGEILAQLHQNMSGETIFYGYEISPQAFELTQSRKSDKVNFYLKDLLEEDIHYDIVMAIDVIEHIEDYFGFLRKLRNKGTFKIFHIPLDLSVQTVFRSTPILTGRKHVGHIHYFTKETALASLQDMGYEILDHFYTAGMVEQPGKPIQSKMLSPIRKLMYKLNKDWTVRILGGYSLMVLSK
ncbi:class I SAM-dependent methyltransferase [Chitinophagaceae bacterium LB-8]|uniref:Class I SAM-dependent methyltransferase n=1 Tax=Paraflavisolibacter caeni TaxID=2982496 RepID=A0A9X2Y0J3_9BACT|nr:methyltransferase domain-containing protein [Paraflavisolibacter caeni]MCU7550848.1 class I SAM-dependent methyltransferase [Paraflavisolibacter caeni]